MPGKLLILDKHCGTIAAVDAGDLPPCRLADVGIATSLVGFFSVASDDPTATVTVQPVAERQGNQFPNETEEEVLAVGRHYREVLLVAGGRMGFRVSAITHAPGSTTTVAIGMQAYAERAI